MLPRAVLYNGDVFEHVWNLPSITDLAYVVVRGLIKSLPGTYVVAVGNQALSALLAVFVQPQYGPLKLQSAPPPNIAVHSKMHRTPLILRRQRPCTMYTHVTTEMAFRNCDKIAGHMPGTITPQRTQPPSGLSNNGQQVPGISPDPYSHPSLPGSGKFPRVLTSLA